MELHLSSGPSTQQHLQNFGGNVPVQRRNKNILVARRQQQQQQQQEDRGRRGAFQEPLGNGNAAAKANTNLLQESFNSVLTQDTNQR